MRVRRLGRARRGVAAVIGTLLALLVFMTLFGIFLTQFLPIWMTDNEAAEANTVAGQFGGVRACMDQLALAQQKSLVCTTPITMASQGVPIFGSPTQATLQFEQIPQLYTNVTFNVAGQIGGPTVNGNFWLNQTPSQLTLNLPDRYYVPVTYSLSMGAVISSEGPTAQSMFFDPGIIGSNESTQTTLTMTMYEMYGATNELSTVGTSEVYVSYLQSQNYTGTNTAVSMNFTTMFPCAWVQFFGSAFKGTLITPTYTPSTCPSSSGPGGFTHVEAYFPPVTYFYITVVYFDVETGLGNPT